MNADLTTYEKLRDIAEDCLETSAEPPVVAPMMKAAKVLAQAALPAIAEEPPGPLRVTAS